jgi:D-proline reductase (dithiol) PrdB
MHLRSEPAFDVDTERERPEWGDPSWRAIPADVTPDDCAVSHLHINDEDVLADPEICLPADGLQQLAAEGMVGAPVEQHVSVMGYQDRGLRDWRDHTAPAIFAHLRDQNADGIVLAPA